MPADLQIHTDASDGVDSPEAIFDSALQRALDTIAITDHDQTRGALIARDRAVQAQLTLDVIVGSEVTSRAGHILALWIEDPIPTFRSPERTVELIWQQGGAAIISHPGAVIPFALGLRRIDRLVDALRPELSGDHAPILAIETANPIPSARQRRSAVIDANRSRWHLPETGGSDAHFHEQVGSAQTQYEGSGEGALRAALANNLTSPELGRYPSLREIGASRLLRQQWRGLLATPKAVLGRDR